MKLEINATISGQKKCTTSYLIKVCYETMNHLIFLKGGSNF